MGDLDYYRQIIRKIINEHAQFEPALGEIEIETVFDVANDHYELVFTGWNGPYRIQVSVLHFDIRDGKIWIQFDGTEEGIAEELLKAGIPRDRIVLAYKHPEIRQHMDFAIG